MKKLVCLFLMLCLMAGCMRTSRHPQLVAVDSLLISQPDSALMLLRQQLPSFGGTEGGGSIADRMYYYLLLADACNKCYDTLPSDSIMHEVTDFYDAHGTANEQVRAHYLLGCVYRDMGEAPQALDCYHTAIERADTTNKDCDYAQLSRVYGQMAQIYYSQRLIEQQYPTVNKAINYTLRANDTLTAISYFWQKSSIYEQVRDYETATAILDSLSSWYKNKGDLQNYARAKGRAVVLLIDIKEYDRVSENIKAYEHSSGLFDTQGNIEKGREVYYYYKGLFFLRQNDTDSAEFYFRKELQYGKDFNNQNAGAKGLAELYQIIHRPDSSAKYALYAYAMNDSMYAQMTTNELERMQAMYDYSRHQEIARKKTEEARIEKTNRQIAIGIIVFIILLFSYVTYRYIRKEKTGLEKYRSALKELTNIRFERESLKSHESEYMQLIANKDKRIAELETFISKYGKQLYFTTANAERCLHESDTYKKLQILAVKGQELTKEDQKVVCMLISEYLPGFDDFMTTNKPRLKANEYPICLLLRLHFKAVEISGMLNLSKSQVSQLCSDIMNKLFEKKGSSKELSAKLVKIF